MAPVLHTKHTQQHTKTILHTLLNISYHTMSHTPTPGKMKTGTGKGKTETTLTKCKKKMSDITCQNGKITTQCDEMAENTLTSFSEELADNKTSCASKNSDSDSVIEV